MVENEFKIMEDELDLWFEEQKEKLAATYQKQINPTHEEGAEKTKTKNTHKQENNPAEHETKYLTALRKVRGEYQERYEKIERKKEQKEKLLGTQKKILTPISYLSGLVLAPIKFGFSLLKTKFLPLLGATTNRFKETAVRKWDKLTTFFIFRIKPHLLNLLRPFNTLLEFFMKPTRKLEAKLSDEKKKLTDDTIKKLQKTIDTLIKIAKVVYTFLKKYSTLVFGKISAVSTKLSEIYNKYYEKYIKPLMPKPKEEEE